MLNLNSWTACAHFDGGRRDPANLFKLRLLDGSRVEVKSV